MAGPEPRVHHGAMTATDVDEYVAALPGATAAVVAELRTRIRSLVPDGEECISYGIPTIDLDGKHVVHFAGFKNHVSVYPLVDTDPELEAALAPYRGGRGTAKFPLDQPLPYDLIEQMVRFLVARHRAR